MSAAVAGSYGINNGLAIEFDTWNNGAKFGDIANDHTSIVDTDAPLARSQVSSAVDLGNIEDGRWHQVSVSWDADTQTLVYTFDGRAVGTLTQDLAEAYFGGPISCTLASPGRRVARATCSRFGSPRSSRSLPMRPTATICRAHMRTVPATLPSNILQTSLRSRAARAMI